MASKDLRLDANVPGPWYIDNSCLPCLRCLDEAGPDTETVLLHLSEDESYVFFTKQPQTDDELAAAESAMEVCPQNAIGKDGSD
jgi:ferredoxin